MKTAVAPVQPFFLVKTKRYLKMRKPSSPIVHYYGFSADADSANTVMAVPDGCVDILLAIEGDKAHGEAYGSVTKCTAIDVRNGADYFGVRFMPGHIPKILDAAIPSLINGSVPITDFSGGADLVEQIALSKNFEGRVELLQSFIGDEWRCDDLLRQLIAVITLKEGNINVAGLEAETGYSTRYINRVFTERLGIAPKLFPRVMRFQSLIQRLNERCNMSLTDLAADCGYYDQAHFIKEFHEFALVAPHEYAHVVDLENYWSKIFMYA
ncbi:MAG: helix-turn-helix domain-containing protein [Oscillospiraceae bacterium]|jgi:AraC-like DNA-binding protein|nr:helix-turn-helix domain-containing protein [Oscillospiraceae bacterium]